MTYKEAIKKEKRWYRKCIIINLYHNSMLLRKKKWTMRLTASSLEISLGMVSESIKLAKAILDNKALEDTTRERALELIK